MCDELDVLAPSYRIAAGLMLAFGGLNGCSLRAAQIDAPAKSRLGAGAPAGSGSSDAPSVSCSGTELGAHSHSASLGSTRLNLVIAPGTYQLDETALTRALLRSAQGVDAYYAGLPIERATIQVSQGSEPGIEGTTRCDGEGMVELGLGPNVDATYLADDWVVTHEFLHLVFPWVNVEEPKYEWVGEGLSTYLEPLVRVRAGSLKETKLWEDLLTDAAQGLPQAGETGLEHDHSWARTYWGGALFWLEADLLIREQTSGQRSLKDALRAIAAQHGNTCTRWSMARIIAAADTGTGTKVLTQVYARRALSGAAPNLDAWWRKLGVALVNEQVVFDDGAPWATLRQAMTRD